MFLPINLSIYFKVVINHQEHLIKNRKLIRLVGGLVEWNLMYLRHMNFSDK